MRQRKLGILELTRKKKKKNLAEYKHLRTILNKENELL